MSCSLKLSFQIHLGIVHSHKTSALFLTSLGCVRKVVFSADCSVLLQPAVNIFEADVFRLLKQRAIKVFSRRLCFSRTSLIGPDALCQTDWRSMIFLKHLWTLPSRLTLSCVLLSLSFLFSFSFTASVFADKVNCLTWQLAHQHISSLSPSENVWCTLFTASLPVC